MNVLTGLIFHFIGGFASGSFYIPYKRVKGWHWESYWIVGGLFSWLIVPPLAAWLTIPHFGEIIHQTGASVIGYTFLFGLLWGVGGLTYGLGVRWLGVSLGSAIILGLCMVFGSIIPALWYNLHPVAGKDTLSMMIGSSWGRTVLFGLLICVVGIVINGRAGMMKEKQVNAPGTDPHGATVEGNDYHFGLGIIVAIVSGVLSACFNFGLEAGQSMASVANEAWKAANPGQGEFLYRNNVVYVVLLWGGLTTNFIWCMILNARNKSFGDYGNAGTPLLSNYIFSAIAGTTWFLQFFFYGMGESRLGNGPSSWILHMSFIILIASMWGILLKEWKGVDRRTVLTNVVGIAVIIVSVLVVGYGNSLK